MIQKRYKNTTLYFDVALSIINDFSKILTLCQCYWSLLNINIFTFFNANMLEFRSSLFPDNRMVLFAWVWLYLLVHHAHCTNAPKTILLVC